MAVKLWKLCIEYHLINCKNNHIRFGHHLRGKVPGIARNLQQRLNEIKTKNSNLSYRVNIGFPQPNVSRSEQFQKRISHIKAHRRNTDLEKQARNRTLTINLDDVKLEWLKTAGPYSIRKIADHYCIFKHLYGDAYFTPRIFLNINYNDQKKYVYYGNVIKPKDTTKKPKVTFEAQPNSFWSLILTNPDGHFTQSNQEYIHWFIGNIPDGKVSDGETIIEYLQPFPPRGAGFQRFIFILYKQEHFLDFSSLKKEGLCLNLSERTFSTLDFYRKLQDSITPIGLAFFQSTWDSSLTHFYHNVLSMRQPHYEYDFPPPYIRPQEWFPLRKPFNTYMDKYRDPKKINEEYLITKLKKTHPFKGPKPTVPFPNAEPYPKNNASWLNTEIKKNRMNWGRINDV